MPHTRRSLSLVLGASVSAGVSYLYIGDEAEKNSGNTTTTTRMSTSTTQDTYKSTLRKRPQVKALSQADVGLEQSLLRQIGYWISSASVYTATQVFYAASASSTLLLPQQPSSVYPVDAQELYDNTTKKKNNKVYHRLFGWLNDLSTSSITNNNTEWDGNQVIQSISFTMLLNLLSSVEHDIKGIDFMLKHEMYRAIGFLATNTTCAKAIAERGTRYGKLALLNLARVHDGDQMNPSSNVGDALHRLVVLDNQECKFGPANLMSLMALAIEEDVPDQFLEFAFWALTKATSQDSLSVPYAWKKKIFGVDTVAKTRKTLLSNEKIWNALVKSSFRPIAVQFQAAKLMKQLTLSEEKHLPLYLSKKTSDRLKLLINWLQSDHVPLVCTALEIVSNLSENKHPHTIRNDLIQMGTLDILRSRMVEAKENQDCRMMAALLHTIQRLSRPFSFSSSSSENEEVFILDKDSLSTWYYDENAVDNPTNDPNEDFFSHPHPHAVMNKKSISGGSGDKYVEGWIELFSSFLRVNKNNYQIQKEAILCLEQIVLHGKYRHQALQEWLFAALDAVLEQVPIEIAITARSVRDAKKSRTRPMIGKIANEKDYEESHAKALRALAFVLDRKECQQEFLRFGGIELLRSLISSPNPNIKRELVRLIANVLACDEMNQEMMSHLVFLQQNEEDDIRTLLTLWATEENKDVKLQSLAHRALLNLNYQKQKHMIKDENNRKSTVKYLDGVNPLHCSNMDEEDYNVDVIFLHGLLGCAHETWICGRNDCESEKHNDIEDYEKNATDVWAKKWLVEDLKKQGWKPRVLSIGYDSNLLASDSVWETRNFKKTSEQILFKLQKAQVGGGSHSKRRPVLFVTHSLGGVLLKQVLLDSAAESNHHRNCNCRRIACEKCDHDDNGCNDDDSLLDHVNGVIFYGVPHHGSPIAQTIQNFKIKSLGIHQHPVTEHLHGTPHLQMLNDWCKNVFERRGISALSLGENLPCKLPVIGFEALVVPPSSADPGFGEFVSLGDATHTNVCKPSSKEDQRYLLAKEFIIKQLLKQNQQSQALASSLDVI